MINVLEILPFQDFLFELADELDEILSYIAYTERAEDFEYIKESIEYLKEKYDKKVEQYGKVGGASPLSKAVRNVITAYGSFQRLLSNHGSKDNGSWDEETPKHMEEAAAGILMNYILVPEETIVVYDERGFHLEVSYS